MPLPGEARQESLGVDAVWADNFSRSDTRIVAVAPAELYRQLSDEQVRQLHYDSSHLNRNGARHFTAAITPALLELEGGVGHAF